ncbi:MAG TPA: HAMP domain-containing sensor histidine kinase [Micromonosporaceae bacterium]
MRHIGMRARVTATLAVGALMLSATIATLSYELIRTSVLADREHSAVRAAGFDAGFVKAQLGPASDPADALGKLNTGAGRRAVLHQDGAWFAVSTDTSADHDIPIGLQQMVETGQSAAQRVRTATGPALVIGIWLSDTSQYYEIVSLSEPERTLNLVGLVLSLVAGGVTLAGAGLGWYTGRRALRPLVSVAEAARGIAAGDLNARLNAGAEPDLERLTSSFNDMVDQLQRRIERDRRFAADVSHELRSPLQTLAAAAAVLSRRRDHLDERSCVAAQLVVEEVDRFQHLVTDLLEITRADSALDLSDVDIRTLARNQCRSRGINPSIVRMPAGTAQRWCVDARRVEQIIGNLLENAERHGGGAVAVRLRRTRAFNVIEVDDVGPGVLPENRELIFRPFVRGATAASRGDTDGAGLGLAIVARLAESHDGRVSVLDRPGGGARFRVELARGPA